MRHLTAALFALLFIAGGAQQVSAAPRVVVTIKPLHALVSGVMAGVAVPELLVGDASSPHVYALKPSDARALHAADLFFRTSDAVEPFSAKIAQTLPARVTVVTLQDAPGIGLLRRRSGDAFEAHGHGRHAHAHGARNAVDGHVWLDPANAKAIVDRIEKALSARDPANASIFKANASALRQKLDALDAEMQRALAPAAGKPYIVAHDAFQYLERRYGLNVIGAISLDPEIPPGAKRLADLRRRIASLGAVCVFGEPQRDRRLIDNLTEGTAARTGVLDPEGFGLEPGPDLYFALMRRLTDDLRACLLQPA